MCCAMEKKPMGASSPPPVCLVVVTRYDGIIARDLVREFTAMPQKCADISLS
jgi:hypothetical protein